MRNFVLTILALILIAPPLLAQQDGFDPVALSAEGWAEQSPGLWTRSVEDGVVQRLAFGEGRLALVPKLQAELNKLTARIAVDPRPELFDAMDQLVSTLAEIHDRPEASLATKRAAPPPGCYPWNLNTDIYTTLFPPPGAFAIVAFAGASWSGNHGLNCPGHVYARTESAFNSPQGFFYDLDYCVDDNQWSGGCGTYSTYPINEVPVDQLTSCSYEAYAYLTVYFGAVVLTEEKESNSCF